MTYCNHPDPDHQMLAAGNTNSTLLSSLGLQTINLTVDALVPNPSCPNGGLLNTALGLGNNCAGITVSNSNGALQTCALLQDNSCCCSSGEPCYLLSLPAASL